MSCIFPSIFIIFSCVSSNVTEQMWDTAFFLFVAFSTSAGVVALVLSVACMAFPLVISFGGSLVTIIASFIAPVDFDIVMVGA